MSERPTVPESPSPLEQRYPTPLRYPGGKQRLGQFFERLLDLNCIGDATYVEAFAGGAGVALYLLVKGRVKGVHLNDVDRSIYAFWYAATRRNDALVKLIRRARISIAEWDRQKEVQRHKRDASLLELGFSTLFLNRTNRSGILRGGIVGGRKQNGQYTIDARYNKDAVIARVQAVGRQARRIALSNYDSRKVADLTFGVGKNAVVYLDPPYFEKGRDLYINHFVDEDHAVLSRRVRRLRQVPWVVTYDNVHTIRRLYGDCNQKQFELDYTADERRVGSELMVLSPCLKAPRSVLR